MTRPRWFPALLVLLVCVVAVPCLGAQEPQPADITVADPPAHISFVDGAALLERDGRSETDLRSMPLLAGDRVRTRAGRVEILFGDGSTLHLDFNTTVDFQSDELVRLLEGRVRLSIPGPRRTVSYRIDAPAAWAQISEPGEYRVSMAENGEIELAVIRGLAELANDAGRTPIGAGERAFARLNTAPSYAYVFNSASWDAFDRWSEDRRDQRLGLSAQYLPDEARAYSASFDRYGSWRHEPTYGYVWYPRVVAGWRPYYYGRWATFRPWGWTWIGTDPWAWPTHHYGRWGFSAGVWFWIPGRHWAPAWVSWAYAPGWVSWCPLGWNNRPVIQIVNVYRGYDPWHAWTVLPRRHFGVDFVHVRARSAGVIDARTRGSFVVRNTAPEITGYAVPRASAPIRAAGTAVPRNGRPNTVYTNLENSRMSPGSPRVVVGDRGSGIGVRGSEVGDRGTVGDRRVVPGSRSNEDRGVTTGAARPRSTAPNAQLSSPGSPGVVSGAPARSRAQTRERVTSPNTQGASPGGADSYSRPGLRAVPRNDPGVNRGDDSSRGTAAQPYRRPPSGAARVPGGVARERSAPAPAMPDSTVRQAPGYRAPEPSRPAYEPRDVYRPRTDDRRAPNNSPPSGIRAVPRGGDSQPAARPRGGGGFEQRSTQEWSRPPMQSRPPVQAAPPQRSSPPPQRSSPPPRMGGGGGVQRSSPPSRASEPSSRSRGENRPSGSAARRRGGN